MQSIMFFSIIDELSKRSTGQNATTLFIFYIVLLRAGMLRLECGHLFQVWVGSLILQPLLEKPCNPRQCSS